MTKRGTSMAVHQTATYNYQYSKYIVDPVAGPFNTIQSAINEAHAAGGIQIVYIRPGTYTEDLTLGASVYLEGAESTAVIIVGEHTPPTSGKLSFTRIEFQATGTESVILSASAGMTSIKFTRCSFVVNDGFICNVDDWTGNILFRYCAGGVSVKNGVVYNTGGSKLEVTNSTLGAGTTRVLTCNGITLLDNAKISCPITLSGTAVSVFEGGCTFEGTITVDTDANLQISNSRITTGAAIGLVASSTVVTKLSNVVIDSTNTYAISGTGSVKTSEVTLPNSTAINATCTEVLSGSVKTGEIFANTILRMDMTGFYSWAAAAPYYDATTLGTFDLLVGGTGYIRGKLVTWVAQTITGMTSGATWFIYIDATGTIGKTSTRTDALFVNNIPLFECLYDETTGTKQQHVARENHAYNYPVSVSNYEHAVIGVVIENANNGANIIAGSTGVKVSISGADVLADHGLDTTISAATDVTWKKFYKNAAGKWAVDATGTDFAGRYNSAGTPTALTAGRFGVYRLYVGKDSGNASTPVYYAVLNTAQYTNAGNAATAIANGTISVADGELALLELAQLGYITFNQGTGAISVFTISKSTLKSTISAGPGAAVATGVSTNTAGFDGMLSGTDTNVQAALDTIDNWGAGTTDKCLMVGNGVGVAPGVLSVGGTGTILTGVAANDPTWTTATYPATIAIGEVLHGSATNVISGLTAGTTGKVLRAVTSAAPAWSTSTFADTYTIGGILHASAANTVTALATGATGTILTGATGAAPAWTTATYPSTIATGDILSATNTNVIGVIAGTGATAYYALTGNGSGVAPTWKIPNQVLFINPQTDTYALLGTDAGKLITMDHAGVNTLTVSKNATQAIAIGAQILVTQLGAGATTIAPEDGGVTLRYDANDTLELDGQYATAALIKIDTDVWLVGGRLKAA